MLLVRKAVHIPWSWEYSLDYDRLPESDMFWCYRYKGGRVPDSQRRDLALATPPLLLKEWLDKPHSMLARTAASREEAITWLWHAVHDLDGELLRYAGSPTLADDRKWRHIRDGFASTWAELGHDNITVNHYWLTGARETELVIIPNKSPTLTI